MGAPFRGGGASPSLLALPTDSDSTLDGTQLPNTRAKSRVQGTPRLAPRTGQEIGSHHKHYLPFDVSNSSEDEAVKPRVKKRREICTISRPSLTPSANDANVASDTLVHKNKPPLSVTDGPSKNLKPISDENIEMSVEPPRRAVKTILRTITTHMIQYMCRYRVQSARYQVNFVKLPGASSSP